MEKYGNKFYGTLSTKHVAFISEDLFDDVYFHARIIAELIIVDSVLKGKKNSHK